MANRTGADSTSAGMGAVAPVRWSSIAIAVQVCGHTVTVRPPASTLCSRSRLKRRSVANRASKLSGLHCCGSHPDIRRPSRQLPIADISKAGHTIADAPYRFVVWRTRVHGLLPVNSFDYCSALLATTNPEALCALCG